MSALALVVEDRAPIALSRSANTDVEAINALEVLIGAHESDVDDLKWQQAEHVAKLLASGMTCRAIARQWNNSRTGKPFNHTHVFFVAKVFSELNRSISPRPLFRDEYNRVSNPPHDEECYTPAGVIERAHTVLGEIDLDPASCSAANAVVRAKRFFTKDDDALRQHWSGRVWLNPPYTREKIERFVEKFVYHQQAGDVTKGIVLVNSATDTRWWAMLHRYAASVCFPTGRVLFLKSNGRREPSWFLGTSIFYFGSDPQMFQQVFECFVWRGESTR